jgi:hypothetical protein
MLCKLCNKREADQTGSHITSAFLLASQIGARGEERGYLITTNPKEDYSENKGDKAVKEDYIFCRNCEKRLGIVESIYSSEITQKIEAKQFEQNFEQIQLRNGITKLICNRTNSIAFQLLIQSNIWRASLSSQQLYNHFKLEKETEERIRFNLDLFLPEIIDFKLAQNPREWMRTTDTCKDLFDALPFILLKAENLENKELTYEYFDNISKSPYHIVLNEYFILPFFGSLDWKDDFFDLKAEVDFDALINKEVTDPIIGILSNDRYFQTVEKIKSLAVNSRLHEIRMLSIQELFRHGIPVTPQTIRQMVIRKINEIKGSG